MPQLALEYTRNMEKVAAAKVLPKLHQILEQVAGVSIDNCKSRALPIDTFLIGTGDEQSAFVHLSIALLAGRPKNQKRAIGEAALKVLEEHFTSFSKKFDLQITVELRDMERDFYFKASG